MARTGHGSAPLAGTGHPLHQGFDVLRRLGRRIDDETVRAVLGQSGLS
ncbi:hypothetical protein [Streptomyces sp. NPDC001286]